MSTIPSSSATTPAAASDLFDAGPDTRTLEAQLLYLRLPVMRSHALELSRQASSEGWDHLRFLTHLIEMEARSRHDKSAQRRIRAARFPVLKNLDTFDWNWPKKIPRQAIESFLTLRFLQRKENLLFFGNPGLGKTHLATAIGYAAALAGKNVLFANAIDVVNRLQTAVVTHSLPAALRQYTNPDLLILDELGYLPLDQHGGDLLFQVISSRYERASIILTTNKVPAQWPSTFNNDAALASAILDRLSHHCHSIVLEGESYRTRKLKN
jgi:DNA replication protein DnaC